MSGNPLFITFEGLDGSGKTTQIKLLKNYFVQHGENNVIVTREPGGTPISEKIRSIVLDAENKNMSDMTEVLLYAASRAQHVEEVIKPALDNGNIIICDRFLDSSIAYQSAARGIPVHTIENINSFATLGIKPDITFLLDIDAESGLKRRFAEAVPDRLEREKISFFEKVRAGYLELSVLYSGRISVLNADDSPDVIHDKIVSIISQS